MSFLDDLKKSISGAADYTVKKTEEVTETAKLRREIRSRNAALAKCFETIGRAYYKKERGTQEAPDGVIAAQMSEADRIKGEIAELRRQLAKLQGYAICQACGAQISEKSVFCPLCGVRLNAERSDNPDSQA